MCDTIGKIVNENYAIFLKNSDRAVNEPQVVEYYGAKDYDSAQDLKCTYISIPQVNHTNAFVLSRPTWIWGGEIGVNEYGVCIGNEAVFTKGKYGKDALIGMDLLRLGLERGKSAKECLNVMVTLLEEYGQGGNCGYDSNFHYDNSFLIMDRKDLYVLETKDKDYVYKKMNRASISNCLSIEEDGDFYKNGVCNFREKYSDILMTFGSKGKQRRACSASMKLENLEDAMFLLRSHQDDNVFRKGSVGSVCMHASNSLTADETTMSMIVELKCQDIIIHITGCSLPCVSFFKTHQLKLNGLIQDFDMCKDTYWQTREAYNRKLVGKKIPFAFYEEFRVLQDKIIQLQDVKEALFLEEEFYQRWNPDTFEKQNTSIIYKDFWTKKNNVFFAK